MSDDIVSRQAAIDAVNNAFDRETLLTGFVRSIAVRAIRDMPSAQQGTCEYWDRESNFCSLYRPSAERRGRWIDIEHAPNGLLYATCSVCGKRQTVEAINYCGNCGARMETGE